MVRAYWQYEFSKYLYQYKGEALAPLQNKLGAFLTTPLVRNIVVQPNNSIDFHEVMDAGKIVQSDKKKKRKTRRRRRTVP